jgi:hypothetical protein
MKVTTLHPDVGSVGQRTPRRPPWTAASSSSAVSSPDSLDLTESPVRGSSETDGGGGGGSGSEHSFVVRGNSKLEAVNYSSGGGSTIVSHNIKLLPIIGEENPESVLSSSTYQQYPAPSPGSVANLGPPGR